MENLVAKFNSSKIRNGKKYLLNIEKSITELINLRKIDINSAQESDINIRTIFQDNLHKHTKKIRGKGYFSKYQSLSGAINDHIELINYILSTDKKFTKTLPNLKIVIEKDLSFLTSGYEYNIEFPS